MSSSPIEAGASARLKASPGGVLKRLLPRTLFGRSILILVTPMILAQVIATWIFYDRLWDNVMRRLSGGVAGDIALVIETRRLLPRSSDQAVLLAFGGASTELGLAIRYDRTLPPIEPRPPGSMVEQQLATALAGRIRLPFQIDERRRVRDVMVSIQLPDAVLEVAVPRKRLTFSTSYIFVLWMIGASFLTSGFATIFMRNQVRSIRRLAIAADLFGKGRDVPNFKPEGATEVRQAAAAFLIMRERIQRQITQRTEMLAGVSHDLRTPLTRMKLELELLGDGEEIQGLKSDVAEMQKMIEGYLDFARGAGSEAPQPTNIVELVDDAVATAQRDGTEITLIAPASLQLPVRRDGLRRCLMNLIGNAGRYGGHVWITVLDHPTLIEVIIDDDGPGIPAAMREAVFRPFFRLEASRNLETGGVGLGLTVARDIIRTHGGDLVLEDSPQMGLRARLLLPK